jgi:outer membrane protein OmpA-like peptidoglycan-associated protein
VRRRYWKAGKARACGGWLAGCAFAGLFICFAYGALVLVPQFEPFVAQSAAVTQPAPNPAAELAGGAPGAARRLAAGAQTAAQPNGSLPEPEPEPEHAAAAGQSQPSMPAPDACAAAMAAALSNARIEFLSASTEIVPASRNVIAVLAALAHACPGRIRIAGHSDNLGPEAVNQQLSLERAESVASAFIEFGLERGRLSVHGYGSSQPIADNATRAGRARNRRIEMTLTE